MLIYLLLGLFPRQGGQLATIFQEVPQYGKICTSLITSQPSPRHPHTGHFAW